MPSEFLLDAAYGAAVVARYSGIALGDPGQPQNFPHYPARPDDDPDCHPSDKESHEHTSTRRRTHFRTSFSRFGTTSSADAGYESDDALGESPVWGPFFSVLALFPKKDQPDQRDAVKRWQAECGVPADPEISIQHGFDEAASEPG